MESNFKEYCKELGDEDKSKVCYWCYRAYHHATHHAMDKVIESHEELMEKLRKQSF